MDETIWINHAILQQANAQYWAERSRFVRDDSDQPDILLAKLLQKMSAKRSAEARRLMGLED